MTYGLSSERRRSKRLARLSWATLMGLAGVTLLGATGCDTVARISFSERRFNSVQPISFNEAGGQCGGLSGQASLGFVLLANDSTPIKPDDDVSLQAVNLDRETVSFSTGSVFSMPDRVCAGTAECPDSFVCSVADQGGTDFGNRCHLSTTVETAGAPTFVGQDESSHALGVLVSRAGSWRGFLPRDVGELVQVDAEAQQIAGPDIGPNRARATDYNGRRHSALSAVLSSWNTVAQMVREDGRQSFFGLWSYGGSSASVFSHVDEVSAGKLWTTSSPQAQSAYKNLTDASTTEGNRNFLYGGILEVLEQGFSDAALADVESRTLVVITDNPDSFQTSSNSAEQVIARAEQMGVSLVFVHIDPAIDANLLRDDHVYYQGKEECASNDDCRNFEECRQVQYFRASGGAPDSIQYPGDDKLDATYCMPARDESGRVGPIAEFQNIACSTGGAYRYLPSSGIPIVRDAMSYLPAYMEAGWTVDVAVGAVESELLFPGEAFRLQTVMSVDVGGTNDSYDFGQKGSVSGVNGDPASTDTRATFFVP
ncbi:hypothetical protein DL240_01180 [Lujinxingia litoralis]|uniref:VWFA domain-containing protein n=1 Tax=Lujinxingia litoralis TaxID=2211119 RepID=A0A328CDQ4_9DELT|nr:VWA domain-containing protein [Lujinxingia litoralis]RAL24853.1 hypothetical protein DL240_01180 [Lujinxingia litoralis]